MSSTKSTPRWRFVTAFNLVVLDERPGRLVFRAAGPRAAQRFRNEVGGHRYQRIPPTERKGRVHSSTITVAVFDETALPVGAALSLSDVEVTTMRGSGNGGQHRNTTDSAVRVVHRPTGLTFRVENGRSQHLNKEAALDMLRVALVTRVEEAARAADARQRKGQVGSGQRGDKRRTIAVQRDSVIDHQLGIETTVRAYQRGDFPALWDRE